jgi:hypothetical protein
MFAIVVDIPSMCVRYVRSALPDAPVVDAEDRRRMRTRRNRRRALGSRYG